MKLYTYSIDAIRVIDGDTIEADIDLGFDVVLRKQKIRLAGIDAPEVRTRNLAEKERGIAAKKYVELMVRESEGARLDSREFRRGRFGREGLQGLTFGIRPVPLRIGFIIGEVFTISGDCLTSINRTLVAEGLATETLSMRRAARVDDNQREIVAELKSVGASVQDLSRVGGGCPDLLVGFRGRSYPLEIKDGNKPPSRRKLTKDQQRWHANWNGDAYVVESVEQALRTIGAIKSIEGRS